MSMAVTVANKSPDELRIKTDFHVHTISSGHGFSTVREICKEAAARGLEMIAVTDHGPAMPGGAHIYYFTNMVVMPRVLSGVKVLRGAECNIIDTDGTLDLHDRALDSLDIVHAGIHPLTGYEGNSVEDNTRAVLAVVESGKVDVLAHPGNPLYPLNYGAVVRAAASKGVLIEINNSSLTYIRKGSLDNCRVILDEAKKADACVCIGSDAHDASLVGIFDHALNLVDEVGLPDERIVNRDASSLLEFFSLRGKKEILFQ
ncbi:MAG: phosphatase [Candidatus Anoxymicrobium japonicum]|uniref:Phosphatase n=1 Tax=Candidatus Anoxymicrobium japonicum TaxID=2013648 RepID=A0A2N3G7F6_9ACTN|nr:MAG: phosphatase [Candidatus Anoxymicrobium japonicum]